MEFFESAWSIIKTIQFRDIIDILAIALIIFGLFRLLRDTRAIQLLKGIALLLLVYFIASLLGLVMLSSLLRAFFEAAVVVIVVIFQPEHVHLVTHLAVHVQIDLFVKVHRRGLAVANGQ